MVDIIVSPVVSFTSHSLHTYSSISKGSSELKFYKIVARYVTSEGFLERSILSSRKWKDRKTEGESWI